MAHGYRFTLHIKFLHTKVKHGIADNRHNSKESNTFELRSIYTIGVVVNLNNDSKNIFWKIIKPELRAKLDIREILNAGLPKPNQINYQTILDTTTNRYQKICWGITTWHIRLLLKEEELFTNTKLVQLPAAEAKSVYKNTKSLKITLNKTKILRLILGYVFVVTD